MRQEMREAVDFLCGLPKFTKKNSLAHTRRLMELLGNPCEDRKVIHVAGSNGKGSVCCFLYHMLLAQGAGAAMFTSPHLVDIRERFQINGDLVGEEDFLAAYGRVSAAVRELTGSGEPHPTFFEFVYAIAMLLFEEARAEYVILETGLGGRLDATNSFPTPSLAVITSISLEHREILGDTIRQIAAEKAGILKAGVPVVYAADDGEAAAVIRAEAERLGCPATEIFVCPDGASGTAALADGEKCCRILETDGDAVGFSVFSAGGGQKFWRIPGHALYQAENAALAIEAMYRLNRGDDAALQRGLLKAKWPGRMQEALPGIYLDGAHNPAGITAFCDSVRAMTRNDAAAPMLLFSMLGDKDIGVSARLLAAGVDWDAVAVTATPGERGVSAGEIGSRFEAETGWPVEEFSDCRDAFYTMSGRRAQGQKLFCAGSLYFIGALMETLEKGT